MLNAPAKAYNQMPKPNSKTQQAKREYEKNHPLNFVTCDKCGQHNVTLYKFEDKYYCKEHIPED